MALQTTLVSFNCFKEKLKFKYSCKLLSSPPPTINSYSLNPTINLRAKLNASTKLVEVVSDDGNSKNDQTQEGEGEGEGEEEEEEEEEELMDEQERREWRKKIRQVMDHHSHVNQVIDPIERKKIMEKLISDYPLVVDEDDPDWPEDANGRGFNLDQFFDKITIKNVRKDNDDGYDSEKEIVWQDDDYIRPIKEITTKEWEETVFKDISPLVVFVHNRYRRPEENDKVREELEKVAHIFWNCSLPSPRCVAVDAVVELDLVSALNVSVFPEVIFTKAGKILYREKAFRSADELSKIMAFFYYGAAKPPCLDLTGDGNEMIPSIPNNTGK